MRKQKELLRRDEKLSKAARPHKYESKPGCCMRCMYYRPDFKYRRCRFSRCPYGCQPNVFRKKPLKRDRFS